MNQEKFQELQLQELRNISKLMTALVTKVGFLEMRCMYLNFDDSELNRQQDLVVALWQEDKKKMEDSGLRKREPER